MKSALCRPNRTGENVRFLMTDRYSTSPPSRSKNTTAYRWPTKVAKTVPLNRSMSSVYRVSPHCIARQRPDTVHQPVAPPHEYTNRFAGPTSSQDARGRGLHESEQRSFNKKHSHLFRTAH